MCLFSRQCISKCVILSNRPQCVKHISDADMLRIPQLHTNPTHRNSASKANHVDADILQILLHSNIKLPYKHLGSPVALSWCDTNLSANGSAAFKWKLHCHWLKGFLSLLSKTGPGLCIYKHLIQHYLHFYNKCHNEAMLTRTHSNDGELQL